VHRIGRTGRCGNVGRSTCFFDPNTDAAMARPLVKVLTDVSCFILLIVHLLNYYSHQLGKVREFENDQAEVGENMILPVIK